MRSVILFSCLVISVAMVQADHQPQLTWRGQVDGPTTLRIHGDRVEVDASSTFGSSPNYQFTSPLPASRQNVQVLVRQGRVDARVVEQHASAALERADIALIGVIDHLRPEDLARDSVYEFAFIFAPLRLKGATGSPGNPLAIR